MAESARSILLRFGTQNVRKARQAVKEITALTRKALRNVKDVGERRELLRQNREEHREDLAAINELGQRQRLGRRQRQLLGRQADQVANELRAFGAQGLEAVGLAKGLAGGSPLSAAAGVVGKFSGPIAIVFQAAQAALEIIRPELERMEQRQRANLEERVKALLDRELFLLDTERRLKEDPGFARERAELFADELQKLQRAQIQNPMGGRVLRGDLDLRDF